MWELPIGVTATKFSDSDKLGKQYESDLFVADIVQDNPYHFGLNHNRIRLTLQDSIADKMAKDPKELDKILLGIGFIDNRSGDLAGITDLDVGPDDYQYVFSYG